MSPFVFFVSIFVLAVFGFCKMALATHACGGETQAVRISRPVGLVCFECHVAIVFFAIYLEPWFFFFTLTRFHPNNFSEHFRQTTKNGSKGAFSVLSPFVVFVLFLSSSFLVLRWLWPRMLVHRHCGLIRLLHLRVLLQPASFFRKMKKANAAH